MEHNDEILHIFFTYVSQQNFEKAKEYIEKQKDPKSSLPSWTIFLQLLQQLNCSEKSYMEMGFLQCQNKRFLRKDSSLKSTYENIKCEFKKINESKNLNESIQSYCESIEEFLSARVALMDLYEKIYMMGLNRHLQYEEILVQIKDIIQSQMSLFIHISLSAIKAIFFLECGILQQLFQALTQLQNLQFVPTLSSIQGAHTRLLAWEKKLQNREVWKIGIVFKNNCLPALYQWLLKLKGAILSKFSLYFHETLAQQTSPIDMRQLCSKLQHDYYQKMVTFQKKYDAAFVIVLSDNKVHCDTTDYDSFPIIVSYPPRSPSQLDIILRLILENAEELSNDNIVFYHLKKQENSTYILHTVERNIYIVIMFEQYKTEKDTYISQFILDLCGNLRCTKQFLNLKNATK